MAVAEDPTTASHCWVLTLTASLSPPFLMFSTAGGDFVPLVSIAGPYSVLALGWKVQLHHWAASGSILRLRQVAVND